MIEEHWPHSNPSWREGEMQFAQTIDAIADRIESEYMPYPLDADGVPCRLGDRVKSGDTCGDIKEMLLFERGGARWEIYLDTLDDSVPADSLRHVKPEPPDTQERIDQDAGKGPCEYFGHDDMSCSEGGECRAASSHDGCYTCQRIDLLRRQRELDARKAEGTNDLHR